MSIKLDTQKEDEFVTITFQVQRKRVPAFRAAMLEIGNKVSDELSKNLPYPKAQALTNAIIALGALRKATMEYGYDEWFDR